jgi:broad specificity phosphatase PhoE
VRIFNKKVKGHPLLIYFVRHGQCEGQGDSGVEDPPLTELGKKQASDVAKYLADVEFDHIYFSIAQRASETAKAIIKQHPETSCTETIELIEVCKDHFMSKPETLDDERRSQVEEECDVMMRFINRLRHNHEDGDKVLVVAHGNIILSLIGLLDGKKPHESILLAIDNASVSLMAYWLSSGLAVLKASNHTGHLPSEERSA